MEIIYKYSMEDLSRIRQFDELISKLESIGGKSIKTVYSKDITPDQWDNACWRLCSEREFSKEDCRIIVRIYHWFNKIDNEFLYTGYVEMNSIEDESDTNKLLNGITMTQEQLIDEIVDELKDLTYYSSAYGENKSFITKTAKTIISKIQS